MVIDAINKLVEYINKLDLNEDDRVYEKENLNVINDESKESINNKTENFF